MRAARLTSITTRPLWLAIFLQALVATHAPDAECRAPRLQDPSAQNAARGWLQIRPRGEEFSFQMPVTPGVYVSQREGDGVYTQIGGAQIKRQFTYHAYYDGAVYLVHAYKASSPQGVMNELSAALRGAVARDVREGGVTAREYETTTDALYQKTRFVIAGKFLYVLEASARDARNPTLDRFLSSFTTGKANPAGGGEASPSNAGADASTQTADAGEVFKQKETTRKAVLVYRPEPLYTDEARRDQITGAVRLRIILSATGRVTNVTALSRLPDGLTEMAIAAAHATHFLPAEKDGRRVSQYVTIDYNFNIY
jgi:TonB family protein